MRLRTTPGGLIAEDPLRGRWARLPGDDDLLTSRRRLILPEDIASAAVFLASDAEVRS